MSKLISPLTEQLNWFYDLIIDRQFWFEANYEKIKEICPKRHKIIYDIYFHPTIIAQLSILNSEVPFRDYELAKLLLLFVTLVEMNYGTRTDLLAGLPPPNILFSTAERPRKNLPVNLPPPVVTPSHSRSNSFTYSFIHKQN